MGAGIKNMKKMMGGKRGYHPESNMNLESSALNISHDQQQDISVNIKYDSFTEEASKFKINSLSKEGGVGPVAEPKNPRPHHHMLNLDRISVSERKALGVFNQDKEEMALMNPSHQTDIHKRDRKDYLRIDTHNLQDQQQPDLG